MTTQLSPHSGETISSELASFCSNLNYDDIPKNVIHRAKLHILDAFGIAVASSVQQYSRKTFRALEELSDLGDYPVIGFDDLAYREAAIMNGFLIHSLDYDDTHVAGVIHATASAIPSVLAASIKYQSNGRQSLMAYIAGIETSARVGMAAKGGFHKNGFHPTGLVGSFGSTLAAGIIANLSQLELIHAQGIVYSMASGNLEFLEEGAWTKRMHPGWAAGCALTAIGLAKHGFEGPLSPYEGRFGLYNTCVDKSVEIDYELATHSLGSDWEMLRVGIKPYPACHLTHACIDSALNLRKKYNLSAKNIKKIFARVHQESMPVISDPINEKRRPRSGYEAQFSLPYLIASAIVRGKVSLEDLNEDAFTEVQVLDLCDRIFCEPMQSSLYPKYFSGEIEIITTNDDVLVYKEEINQGADKRPLSEDKIINKFIDNAKLGLPLSEANKIVDKTMDFEKFENIVEYFRLFKN
tara:strand:- start:1219 stop:2619 length:1401 start_codon:yes stop_codon:yes gene_type:complete